MPFSGPRDGPVLAPMSDSAGADRPMLILVPLPPTYRGGTEEYAYRLARRFSATMPVRVLTTTVDPTPNSPPVETGGVPIDRLDARAIFQRPLVRGTANATLRAAVDSARLVQLHMPFPFVERRVVQWARAAKVPVVLTYHMDADLGGAGGAPGSGLVTRGYRQFSAYPALRGADRVVSNSLGYARASPVLSKFLDKVRVIGKGVDLARLGLTGPIPPGRAEPGPTLLPGATPGEKRILFVGRMVPYKGLPNLLRAVASLRDSEPGLVVYLAGKGPERPALESLTSELGLQDRVRFLGFVPDDALGELYRSADLVACPSIGQLESTPTCLEEAGAVGTPILGSNLPGADEALPHDGVHGLLCPPGDIDAVARAIQRLIGQPRPAARASPRTWDDTAAEYIALFEELGVETGTRADAHNPDIGRAG